MVILQVEHPVQDFDSWKKTFDSDPANRKQSGVRRYRIFRQVDNPNLVVVELEFDDSENAKKFLQALQRVWKQMEGKIITGPKARVMEMVESKEY